MSTFTIHQADLSVEITNDIRINNELVLVKKIDTAKTKQGKDYYSVTIANKLGKTFIKIWDIVDKLKVGDFISVSMRGDIHERFGPQWKVFSYRKVDYEGDPGFDSLLYQPDTEQMYNEMIGFPYNNHTVNDRHFLTLAIKLVNKYHPFQAC